MNNSPGWHMVGWLVGCRSVCGHRLSLCPLGFTSAVCDMDSAAALRYAACGAIQVLYVFASLYVHLLISHWLIHVRPVC